MIRHISGIAEIVDDVEAAAKFYRDVLGLKVKYEMGSGYALVEMDGVLHFGIWGRAEAAKVVFGNENELDKVPLGFTVGFEVDSASDASQSIVGKGWPVAQQEKKESWGQVTSRFYSSSGALCEFSETPGARKIIQPMKTSEGDK
jgi:catechol 2,3-dioxygenase-like lactoylglutathione lyase family enzyme